MQNKISTIILSFQILCTILFLSSCKENSKSDPKSELNKIIFDDQIELIIDDKYFNCYVDSILNPINEFRFDMLNSKQFLRVWYRHYNNMVEYRCFNFEIEKSIDSTTSIHLYNYLVGIRNQKAFYIRWRNEQKEPKNKFTFPITSDIGEFTIILQTNLSSKIIRHYFPKIKCNIEFKSANKLYIKEFDYTQIFLSKYKPLVE